MKNYILVILGLCLLSMSLLADDKEDKKMVEKVIREFTDSINKQDVEGVGKALHPKYQNYMATRKGLMVISQEQYIGLIKAKRIGNSKRKVEIENMDIMGLTATAKVNFISNETSSLVYTMFIMKVDGEWKIVSMTTVVVNFN